MTRAFVVLALLLLASPSAAQSTPPTLRWLQQHASFTPTPPQWRRWWDDVALKCKCNTAQSFDSLRVFVFDDVVMPGDAAAARLYGGFVVIGRRWLGNETIVKHELLHVALGTHGHPRIFRDLGLDTEWINRTLAGRTIQ